MAIDFSLHHHGAAKKNTRTEIISKYLTVSVHVVKAVVSIKSLFRLVYTLPMPVKESFNITS